MTAFREIVGFEVAHYARQRATWIYGAVFMGVAFLAMTSFVSGARGSLFNAPLAIAGSTIVVSMLGLLVTAALAGDVATRDANARIEPLLHTAPISKTTYLGARFLGAFAVNALLLVLVPVALVAAGLAQPLDPEFIGPFRPAAYLGAYALFALPNAFVTTALLFSLATLNRTAVASYVGALVLFLGAMLNEGVVAEAMGRWEEASLLDPFGIVLLRSLVQSWTPAEKDTLLIAFEGTLLLNRALWMAIGVAALALTLVRFRFGHRSPRPYRRGSRLEGVSLKPSVSPASAPHVRRTFSTATRVRQTLDIAGRSFRSIAMSRGAVVLAIPALFMMVAAHNLMVHMGTPLTPTTAYIVSLFVNSGDIFLAIPAPFLIVVFAGELVWRERDAGLSDIADATPVPDWVPFAGKLLGLSLILVLLQALLMTAGILTQAAMGYYDFEVGLYLRVLFGLQLSNYLLFAVLALAVHVLVNQKYVAHIFVLLAYAFTIFARDLGVEHNLLVYGADPGWAYSDMRGFGPFLWPVVSFRLYWAAWAGLLAVAATLFWVRGRQRGFRPRVQLAQRRFTGAVAGAGATALIGVVSLGGFIFYNTNVLNAYTTTSDRMGQRAEYERRYARYRTVPQPQLTAANLQVEIHPERRRLEIRGTLTLVNKTALPIAAVHVVTASDAEVRSLRLDREAAEVRADDGLGHRIFQLATALPPAESLTLIFDLQVEPHGFTNSALDASVAADATYVSHRRWLPVIGYQSSRELQSVEERRTHGLPPRPATPALDDEQARHEMEGAERITVEAVVGTDEGQVAVAPGTLRRTWTANGRRYFHYATDAPIRNDYAFFSAAYAVHEAEWRPSTRAARSGQADVAIEILHHPNHGANLDRMVRGALASLDYYTTHFGPYPHREIRFIEHPGDGNSLHAAPINISYEEGFALFNPTADERKIDLPFAIVAHEVAHQWWGNQVSPAFVEGGALVSESVAWYSAMAVVEQAYGPDHLRRLLNVLRDAYLSPRVRAGVPLLRASDRFTAYRKGPFAMYALREYVGEQPVNTALRRLLEAHGSGTPPLPTSLDLYRELQAVTPNSLQSLLADLFERNTFWELSTQSATAEQDEAGDWQVALDVHARKVVVDSDGVETELPMDDLVEIGIYAAAHGSDNGDPLHLRMHRVSSGAQRITVTVPREPARAGIDPRHLLIDVDLDDNVAGVVRGPAKASRQ